jgi:hypothetical protein
MVADHGADARKLTAARHRETFQRNDERAAALKERPAREAAI